MKYSFDYFSPMDITRIFIVIILMLSSIPTAIIYFYIFNGYIMDTIISRITKASFILNLEHIFDLWIGYCITILAYIYILIPFIYKNDKYIISTNWIMFMGFVFIFIGRIITHKRGVFYGKIHFTGLFVLASLYLFLNAGNFFINFFNNEGNIINVFDSYSKAFIYHLDYFKEIFPQFIVGTVILSTIGELYLCKSATGTDRSLMLVSDKLPSDFKVISGGKEINKKIDEMFKDRTIIRLLCATKSCRISEIFYKYIYNEFTIDCKFNKAFDYRIIRWPSTSVIDEYDQNGDLENKINYLSRLRKLNELKLRGIIDVNEIYLGELKFLILEYDNKERKMLLIIRDKGPRKSRVGLYTEEPYIIQQFVNIFDAAWQNPASSHDPAKT